MTATISHLGISQSELQAGQTKAPEIYFPQTMRETAHENNFLNKGVTSTEGSQQIWNTHFKEFLLLYEEWQLLKCKALATVASAEWAQWYQLLYSLPMWQGQYTVLGLRWSLLGEHVPNKHKAPGLNPQN